MNIFIDHMHEKKSEEKEYIAIFHKSIKTEELIDGAGCKLLFLSTHSPDLNKIDPKWAKLKDRMRK